MLPSEVRAWREVRGLSQAGLARVLSVDGKVSQATVSRWEAGKRPAPAYLRPALERLSAPPLSDKDKGRLAVLCAQEDPQDRSYLASSADIPLLARLLSAVLGTGP